MVGGAAWEILPEPRRICIPRQRGERAKCRALNKTLAGVNGIDVADSSAVEVCAELLLLVLLLVLPSDLKKQARRIRG
jgi:hypothetical protein